MADKNQIILELKAKTTKLEAGLKKVQKQIHKTDKGFDRMRISTAKIRRGIGALRNNMLLVSFALGGTAASVGKLVKAYGEQQLAERKLQQALGFTSEALLTQASALQQTTAFGDEAIIGVQALIGAFTKDEEQIKQLTKTTLDLAAAKGMELTAAADLVSKSFGSSTNALSRYGIQVEGAVGSTERLENLTGNVAALFGGQASAQADTMTGSIEQMKNALGDTAEAMGGILEPATISLSGSIKSAAESLSEFFLQLKETDMETLARQLRELGISGKDIALIDEFIKIDEHTESLITNNSKIVELLRREGIGYVNLKHQTKELSNAELELLGVKVENRSNDEEGLNLRDRSIEISSAELVTEGKLKGMISSRVGTVLELVKGQDELTTAQLNGVDLYLGEIDFLKVMLKLVKDRESAEKSLANIGVDPPPPPPDPTEFDLFLAKQNEKLAAYEKEQNLIDSLVILHPELAASLGLVTDARKEDLKVQDDINKAMQKDVDDYEKGKATKEKARDKERKQITKDSMAIGRMAMTDSKAAKNAALDKIASYAMSAAAKQMEKIITQVPFPFNIPLAAAGGLAIGAAVGGLADTLKGAEYGMNEVVDQPTLILAGEAGAEQVSITPLESPNIEGVQGGGASLVVNVSGNVLTSDFVEGELADNIREAVRRGTDFGIG